MSVLINYEKTSSKNFERHVSQTPLELFPLGATYVSIELPLRSIKGRQCHIYPSDRIVDVFNRTEGKIHKKLESFSLLPDEITIYLKEDVLERKIVTINNNRLYRNNKKLKLGNYIYVIDSNDKLYVTKKKTISKGKYCHSSLTSGMPVKSAGFLEVGEYKKNREYYIFNNVSGHYKPSTVSILQVALWLKQNKLKSKKSQYTEISLRKVDIMFFAIYPKK